MRSVIQAVSFILLDECVAKCCVDGATIYTAQRTSTVQCPGRGADDLMIYEFARAVGCILVTQNGRDFATLCVRYGPLPVIVLPAAPPRFQHAYLRWIIPGARGLRSNPSVQQDEIIEELSAIHDPRPAGGY